MGRARPGQPLRIPAADWNRLAIQANRPLNGNGYLPPLGFPSHDGSILIRNRSSDGETRERFEVLALDSAPFSLDETYQQQPIFDGITPTWPGSMGAIAVLQEALPYNQVGRALVSGVTIAKFNFEPADNEYGPFADFHDGEYYLRSRPMGGARRVGNMLGAGITYETVVVGSLILPVYLASAPASTWGVGETKTDVTGFYGAAGAARFSTVRPTFVGELLGSGYPLLIQTVFRDAAGYATGGKMHDPD